MEDAQESDQATLLKLVSFGDKKISVIKAIREIFPLGLKEAKTVVEAAPVLLSSGTAVFGIRLPSMSTGLDVASAATILHNAGAKTEIVDASRDATDSEADVMSEISRQMNRISTHAQDRVACWVFDRWGR